MQPEKSETGVVSKYTIENLNACSRNAHLKVKHNAR